MRDDKRVFVFDFDLTLTNEHTAGVPEPHEMGVMSSDTQRRLEILFAKLARHNMPVYINTRGNVSKIKAFLKNKHLFVKEIKGASSDAEIADPYRNDDHFDDVLRTMGTMGIRVSRTMDESTIVWAYRKQELLQEIARQERVKPSQVYFFDDTAVNVRTAKMFGFQNSYRVMKPGNQLWLMDKLRRLKILPAIEELTKLNLFRVGVMYHDLPSRL